MTIPTNIRWIVRLRWAAFLTVSLPVAAVLAYLAYVLGSPGDAAYIVRDYRKLWAAVITGRQQ